MSELKVAQIAFPFLPTQGGREIFIKRLSDGLADSGIPVTVFADSAAKGEVVNQNRFSITSLDLESLSVDSVVEHLEKLRPTILHFHNILGPWPFIFSQAVKRLSYKPISLLTYHSLVNLKSLSLEHRWRHLSNFFDALVFPSKYNYELFKRLSAVEQSKLKMIYNGVPVRIRNTKTSEAIDKSVIYAGRLTSDKGVSILLAAWVVLKERFDDYKLKIIGDGAQRPFLEKYAAALGLSESVLFMGWLDQESLENELRRACFIVVPSTVEEPFGLIAAEAAALGLPVVASDIGGLPEIVEDSVTGYLTPVGDISSLISACTNLMRDPTLRHQYGEAAKDRVRRYFDVEFCTAAYINLYKELVNDSKTIS